MGKIKGKLNIKLDVKMTDVLQIFPSFGDKNTVNNGQNIQFTQPLPLVEERQTLLIYQPIAMRRQG